MSETTKVYDLFLAYFARKYQNTVEKLFSLRIVQCSQDPRGASQNRVLITTHPEAYLLTTTPLETHLLTLPLKIFYPPKLFVEDMERTVNLNISRPL